MKNKFRSFINGNYYFIIAVVLYNSLVSYDEAAKAWADVEAAHQRRIDLTGNLVKTKIRMKVKKFEKKHCYSSSRSTRKSNFHPI